MSSIVGAGGHPARSMLRSWAKAGKKSSCLLEAGTRLASLCDLISSDIWDGGSSRPGLRSLLEGKKSGCLCLPGRMGGASAVAALHYFANFPGP